MWVSVDAQGKGCNRYGSSENRVSYNSSTLFIHVIQRHVTGECDYVIMIHTKKESMS